MPGASPGASRPTPPWRGVATAALLAIGAALAPAARAQVNAETLAAQATQPGWQLGAALSTAYHEGNTRFLQVQGGLSVQYLTLLDRRAPGEPPSGPEDSPWFRDRFIVDLDAGFKRFNDTRVTDQRFAHLRYTRMVVRRVGLDVYGQAGSDQVLLQRWRVLGGAGVRVVAANTRRFRAWIGSGYMVEWEDRLVPEGGVDPRYELDHRWSSYLALRATLVPGWLDLVSTTYAQPRFDRLRDVQFLEEAQLDLTIRDVVRLSVGLRVRHDADPPLALRRTDLRVYQGITVALQGPKVRADDDDAAPEAPTDP